MPPRAHTRVHNFYRHYIPDLHFGQFNKNDIVIQIQSFVMFIGSIQVISIVLLFHVFAKKRGFISLSRSVMKCSVEVAAGVFARFSCRHSWNLRLRLTESDNHRPANTIDVLRPKLSMLSWHSSIATSVMAVRMSMQQPCKLILSGRNCIAI